MNDPKNQNPPDGKNSFLLFFNYFFLVFLGAGIAVGFLPIRILKGIDELTWTYPFALTAVFLTWTFLLINRKAISEVLTKFFSPPFPDRSVVEKLTHSIQPKYFLAVGVLMIIAFMMFSYRLDAKDFWDDEYLILRAAKGYSETATFYSWDFIKDAPSKTEYTRAWPHTLIVAQSYKLLGVSEWSTRIVSVIAGCIFVGVSFFVCAYFSQNFLFSLIVSIVFLLNPDFIYYWRYARMYAILLPVFFIWAFFVHKAVEGSPRNKATERQKKSLLASYLNFNWGYVALSLIVLYFAYHIHMNSMILPLATVVYIFLIAVTARERKYIALLTAAGIAGLTAYPLIPQKLNENLTYYLLLFKAYNPIYLQLIVQRPFHSIISLGLLAGSLVIVFLAPCKEIRRKLGFCVSIVFTAIVFFVFCANFYDNHYRFISHLVPFAILMICFVYFIVIKIFKNKHVLAIGIAMLLLSQAANFIHLQKVLYQAASMQPFPSVAYKTVKEKLKPNEVIFAQGIKDYYMAGIPTTTPIISLGNIEQGTAGTHSYRFDQFFNDLLAYRQGWVIWEKYKEFHIDPKVAAYAMTLFKKYHGKGVDNSGVEVYYFDESMIKKPVFK